MNRTQPTPPAPSGGAPVKQRRCPSCRVVQDAAAFEPLAPGASLDEGFSRRRCPGCGYAGPTREFVVVVGPTVT
ncbi:MAG: hypothetical protein AB7R89_30925 [Dehalococcoidia bacterium]